MEERRHRACRTRCLYNSMAKVISSLPPPPSPPLFSASSAPPRFSPLASYADAFVPPPPPPPPRPSDELVCGVCLDKCATVYYLSDKTVYLQGSAGGISQSHPEAKEYQHKGIEYWDELCIFLGNSTATGEHSVTNKENRFNIEDDIMIPDIIIDDVEIIPDDNEYRQAQSSNKKKRKSTNASNPGRKNIGEGKEEVLMLIDAIENFQDKKYQKKAEYEGHNWLAALNEIPDLDMNLKLCASQYMTSSEIKLHFISMSLEERRAWLVLMSAKSQIG